MRRVYFPLVFFICNVLIVSAWDQFELEMFDLIEEINADFYDFLNVPKTASTSEIKKAYRLLSLELHPDRNIDDPNASVKFRQLSIIYQILKDKTRRESYDEVLENGMPDWRTPVFYYRTLRKMSNAELGVLVSILSITIHFATMWGFAFERRWTMREKLENHMKRHKASEKKKISIDLEIAEQLKSIPSPTIKDLLPFAIIRGMYNAVVSIPIGLAALRNLLYGEVEKFRKEKQELNEMKKVQEDKLQRKEQKRKEKNKQKANREPAFDDIMPPDYLVVSNLFVSTDEASQKDKLPTGTEIPWTSDDEVLLIRLTNKYPGGFPHRWTKISEIMGRNVADITAKASEIANRISSRMLINPTAHEDSEAGSSADEEEEEYYLSKRKAKRAGKITNGQPRIGEEDSVKQNAEEVNKEGEEEQEAYISRKKQKQSVKQTTARDTVQRSGEWSQKEQNQLETAMKTLPKGTPERWQRIAECIPTKSLPEITARVKYLSDMSKQAP